MVFSKPYPTITILAVTLWLSMGLMEANASDGCISARVSEQVQMPDGKAYPAGSLRICLDSKLNPVSGLHETWIDGQPVGRFVSRLGVPEDRGGLEQAIIQFGRTSTGNLVLEAYAVPEGDRWTTYRLTEPRPMKARELTAVGSAEPAVVLSAAHVIEIGN